MNEPTIVIPLSWFEDGKSGAVVDLLKKFNLIQPQAPEPSEETRHYKHRAAVRDEAYTVLNGVRGMLMHEYGVCKGHESPAQIEQALRHLLAKLEGDYAPQIGRLKETLIQQCAKEPAGVADIADAADQLIAELVMQIRQLTDQRDDLTRNANDFYRKGVEAMREEAEGIFRGFLGPTVVDRAVEQLADEAAELTKGEQP